MLSGLVWSVVCRGMHEYQTAYRAWSEHEWAALLTSHFQRYQLPAIAYCLVPQTDFLLPFFKEVSPLAFAHLLFGEELVAAALSRMVNVLLTWGTGPRPKGRRCS